MSKPFRWSFDTEGEANAFRQGIEYATDGSMEVLEVVPERHGWIVVVQDKENDSD